MKESIQVRRVKHYRRFFDSDDGQFILHDLMRTHFFTSTTHVKGDPYESKLNEGERNVILRIFSICKTDPVEIQNQINKMIEEGQQNG